MSSPLPGGLLFQSGSSLAKPSDARLGQYIVSVARQPSKSKRQCMRECTSSHGLPLPKGNSKPVQAHVAVVINLDNVLHVELLRHHLPECYSLKSERLVRVLRPQAQSASDLASSAQQEARLAQPQEDSFVYT